MTEHMTIAEFRARYEVGRNGRAIERPGSGAGPAPHKYRAQPTIGPDPAGGERRYDSKLGARLAESLQRERAEGRCTWWAPEVSLPMGTDENGRRVRYRADALVCWADGTVEWLDAKGKDTAASRAKRAALRDLYGIRVRLVRRGDL